MSKAGTAPQRLGDAVLLDTSRCADDAGRSGPVRQKWIDRLTDVEARSARVNQCYRSPRQPWLSVAAQIHSRRRPFIRVHLWFKTKPSSLRRTDNILLPKPIGEEARHGALLSLIEAGDELLHLAIVEPQPAAPRATVNLER